MYTDSSQLLNHRIKSLALNELHRVISVLAVLSDVEYRNDIGVVQAGQRSVLHAGIELARSRRWLC